MTRDQDREAAHFEWVNAWAALNKAETASADAVEAVLTAREPVETKPVPVVRVAMPVRQLSNDQLLRDIAEIERTRDALAAAPQSYPFVKRRTQALTLVPSRTSDAVPVMIGGVLALVMLTVFGAAAAMGKLAR